MAQGSRNPLLQGSDASGPHYRADNLQQGLEEEFCFELT